MLSETTLKLCHWFTVDDLVYLKRGGRISSVAAFFGTVIGIKPVLHMDNEGHLVNVTKVRGRKTSVEALAQKYDELALNTKEGTLYIRSLLHQGEERQFAYEFYSIQKLCLLKFFSSNNKAASLFTRSIAFLY